MDSGPNTWRPSGLWQMPRRMRRSARSLEMSSPSKTMRPLMGCTPDRLRRKVVLPAPLAPTRASSPRRTSMSMPFSALIRP
jgi:hypothetical protein